MNDTRYDVVGIGNAIVDIIVRCDEAFLSKHSLDKGFMRLIEAHQADQLYALMGPGRTLRRIGRQHHRRPCLLWRPRRLHRPRRRRSVRPGVHP